MNNEGRYNINDIGSNKYPNIQLLAIDISIYLLLTILSNYFLLYYLIIYTNQHFNQIQDIILILPELISTAVIHL